MTPRHKATGPGEVTIGASSVIGGVRVPVRYAEGVLADKLAWIAAEQADADELKAAIAQAKAHQPARALESA